MLNYEHFAQQALWPIPMARMELSVCHTGLTDLYEFGWSVHDVHHDEQLELATLGACKGADALRIWPELSLAALGALRQYTCPFG